MDVRLTLKETTLDRASGKFIGTFDLQNVSKQKQIVIGVSSSASADSFSVPYPDASVEYLDLLGQWKPLLNVPGSFLGTSMRRTVEPGKSVLVNAVLVTQDMAEKNGRDFRLILRTADPSVCLISAPFRGQSDRPAVTRLVNAAERP